MSLFSPAIESLRDLQRASALDKVRKRLGVWRASLGSLSESVAIFDPGPLKEDCCYVLDRGYATFGLWNVINAKGSSYVCRVRDKTAATVTQVNPLTEVDRAASVISDEIIDVGWKSRQRTRPDHPMRGRIGRWSRWSGTT